MPAISIASRVCCCLVAAALCGCSLPEQHADFTSEDPKERTLALLAAAEQPGAAEDPEVTRQLITMLDSSESEERMLAAGALERLTGESQGFDYSAPEADRNAAVDRWVEWHNRRFAGAPGAETSP